uniref:Uncharacterized protein n=1 Tax=Arundo donax TaxID=35708 RepID=A0A0A9B1I8_ARUDO
MSTKSKFKNMKQFKFEFQISKQ